MLLSMLRAATGVLVAVICCGAGTVQQGQCEQLAEETTDRIFRDFKGERGLLVEQIALNPAVHEKQQPAFLWSASVQLSTLVSAARVNPAKYRDPLQQYIEALRQH